MKDDRAGPMRCQHPAPSFRRGVSGLVSVARPRRRVLAISAPELHLNIRYFHCRARATILRASVLPTDRLQGRTFWRYLAVYSSSLGSIFDSTKRRYDSRGGIGKDRILDSAGTAKSGGTPSQGEPDTEQLPFASPWTVRLGGDDGGCLCALACALALEEFALRRVQQKKEGCVVSRSQRGE